MTRWKLTIEYDGTDFCGWQKQTNAPSVQQTIEEAVKSFCGEDAALFVAGRTDTGVHARGQVAHVDIQKETTGDVIRDAVNFYVKPNKIAILSAEQVGEDFHARTSAIKRSYRYRIVNRRPPLTFQTNYAWHIPTPLDAEAMQAAATHLLGKHDFTTFRAAYCQANSPIKTLDTLNVTREGENVFIFVEARSFLYHQVRNMVGTLMLVGNGQWSLEDFKTAFAACDRTKGGPTAPAQGLCFWSATYPQK